MSEKSQTPFKKQHNKPSQTLLKSTQQHFYHIYWSLRRKLSWKKSLLVICKILGLNTSTADKKYSLLDRDNLTQPIQKQLSKKEKNLFWTFSCILEI